MSAVVDWYARATALRPIRGAEPPRREWGPLLNRAREALKGAVIADHHRWVDAVKHVQRVLPRLTRIWESRPIKHLVSRGPAPRERHAPGVEGERAGQVAC